MKKRFACPDCHAPLTVAPTVDQHTACPQCGRRADVHLRPAFIAGSAETVIEDEPAQPGAPLTTRRRKEKHRQRPAPSALARGRWLVVAAAGGVLVVVGLVTLVAVVLLLRGRDSKQQVDLEGDREAIELAAPINAFPPVAWTLRPGPGPKVVFPERLTAEYEKGFARVVCLPGRGPEYLSIEGDPGLDGLCYGRFDLTTGKPVGPARKLKDVKGQRVKATLHGGTNHKVTPAAVSPTGTLVIDCGVGKERLLPIYDPGQDTPRTLSGLTLVEPKGTREPSWFDFAADEKLWVVKGGTLVAWDLAAGKPAFTTTGRFTVPALMGPIGNGWWLRSMTNTWKSWTP